jgi:hypothetical protein
VRESDLSNEKSPRNFPPPDDAPGASSISRIHRMNPKTPQNELRMPSPLPQRVLEVSLCNSFKSVDVLGTILLVWFLPIYRLKGVLISALQTCEHHGVNYNSFVLFSCAFHCDFCPLRIFSAEGQSEEFCGGAPIIFCSLF